MGQRSPSNPRYQKHTKPEGKTRRSAASAKPARDAGKTASQASKGSGKAAGKSSNAVPMTPEYRKWRNVWWGALVASASCAIVYLLIAKQPVAPQAKLGLLVVCYIFLGIGMYVDWRKVRPARHAAMHGGSGSGAKGGATAKSESSSGAKDE